MKMQRRVLGYTVKCRDEFGSFVVGLSQNVKQARRDYESMMQSSQYSEKTKKTMKVIRIVEVEEEVELA